MLKFLPRISIKTSPTHFLYSLVISFSEIFSNVKCISIFSVYKRNDVGSKSLEICFQGLSPKKKNKEMENEFWNGTQNFGTGQHLNELYKEK